MSAFLRNLIRSEMKSCRGKIDYRSEESSSRNAMVMAKKKNNGEVFEHYNCSFCGGWHIGHRTNFDWIPASHLNHTILICEHLCECAKVFYTNTVLSDRILNRFPAILQSEEHQVKCPFCRSVVVENRRRKTVPLPSISPESTVTIEEIWELGKLVPVVSRYE